MRRLVLCGVVIAMAALQAAGAQVPEACRRVPLIDAEAGGPVRGVEDIAVDRQAGRLYLSAFDRWALADALAAGRDALPQGGLFALGVEQLAAAPERLAVQPLTAGLAGDFHPHGIALDRHAAPRRLLAINHAHEDAGDGRRRRTRIDVFEVRDGGLEPAGRLAHPELSCANDLAALSDGRVLVTRDHGACAGSGRWLEDILALRRARVLLAGRDARGDTTVATVAGGLGFANGAALSPDGTRLAVAATREGRVHLYDVADLLAGDAAPRRRIAVDGGPDNLTWTPAGTILAAVHPSLWRAGMALNRWFGVRRAGSRVAAIDPDAGTARVVLDDAAGTRLNMATVAVAVDDTLVVAGILDDALLVCPGVRA